MKIPQQYCTEHCNVRQGRSISVRQHRSHLASRTRARIQLRLVGGQVEGFIAGRIDALAKRTHALLGLRNGSSLSLLVSPKNNSSRCVTQPQRGARKRLRIQPAKPAVCSPAQLAPSPPAMAQEASSASENARCDALKDFALSKNPAVRYMLSQLERAGCGLAAGAVECRRCDGAMAGGFQDDGGIVLCSNHVATQGHASTTLVHEAIHAFDQCRAKVDWGNCVHHACSEIRAAALSGDCSFGREVFLRRNFGWAKQFQRCVQRRAEISVAMNPNCDSLETKRAVRTAWDVCYNDTAPFPSLP